MHGRDSRSLRAEGEAISYINVIPASPIVIPAYAGIQVIAREPPATAAISYINLAHNYQRYVTLKLGINSPTFEGLTLFDRNGQTRSPSTFDLMTFDLSYTLTSVREADTMDCHAY